MPPVCSICRHPDVDAVDRALLAKEPLRIIAERTGTSATALFRHKGAHLPVTLVKAHAADEAARGDDLLAQLRSLQARTMALLDQAEAAGKLSAALAAIGQARQNIELLAKLLGELDERPQVNLLIAPEWLTVRTVLLEVLQPYPAARVAVADGLAALSEAAS